MMFEDLKARRRAARKMKALSRATLMLNDHMLKDLGLGDLRRDRDGVGRLDLPGMWNRGAGC
jgi:hypothetical protein